MEDSSSLFNNGERRQYIREVNPAAISTSLTASTQNNGRSFIQIQNVGTNPLYLTLGLGASITAYHAVLKGGTGANDGNGGIFSNVGYKGIITVSGATPTYVVMEIN